ncbi:MAG: hypothetical protein KGZ69_15745 [Methylomonas sp.]|nr:hypothetical protein [Methylomonas sp.]
MYINKKSILIVSIVAALLFDSAQADVLYTEKGNDGLGNSFNITFDWNSSTASIDSVISASFTDRTGFYELTNVKISQNPQITDWADWKANHDWIAYDIATGYPGWLDISIGLTITTVPAPAAIQNYGLTPYAMTLGNGGVTYTYYFDPSSVSISPAFSGVPLPPSIWLFVFALAYFGLLGQRRATA